MQPRFVEIKQALLHQIETGQLRPGDKVASENQLAVVHQVSRMTARRALTELVDEGILARAQGAGTFVSDERPMSSLLTITGIKEEIEARHQHYRLQVLVHEARAGTRAIAGFLGLNEPQTLFYCQLVHWQNHQPVQLESRWVNPHLAPAFLQQNLQSHSVNAYLSQVAPLTEADHSVEAHLADATVAQLLEIEPAEACLAIHRRTFCRQGIVSIATLTHPGARYRLGSHLNFSDAQEVL